MCQALWWLGLSCWATQSKIHALMELMFSGITSVLTAPCLTFGVVFPVFPWRPHNPHNLNTSELEFIMNGTKNSSSPDMASSPHHSFTHLTHLVLSLHLLSTLLQSLSQMSLLLCISNSLSTGSSPSLTEISAKASHLACLSLASFLFTLFLSHHYCHT